MWIGGGFYHTFVVSSLEETVVGHIFQNVIVKRVTQGSEMLAVVPDHMAFYFY